MDRPDAARSCLRRAARSPPSWAGQQARASSTSRARSGSSPSPAARGARSSAADLVGQEGDILHFAVATRTRSTTLDARRARTRTRSTTDAGRHRRRRQRRRLHRQRPARGRPRGARSSSRTPTVVRAPPTDARRHRVVRRRRLRGQRRCTRPASTRCDVVVAATGDDEDNLVVSLLAKQEFAVPRVVARVNHPKNQWLFNETWGVDVSVSTPHLLTALVEEAVSVGSLVRLLQFEGGQARLVEVTLADDSPVADQATPRARRAPRRHDRRRRPRRATWWCPGATPCSRPATRCSAWSRRTPRTRSAASSPARAPSHRCPRPSGAS